MLLVRCWLRAVGGKVLAGHRACGQKPGLVSEEPSSVIPLVLSTLLEPSSGAICNIWELRAHYQAHKSLLTLTLLPNLLCLGHTGLLPVCCVCQVCSCCEAFVLGLSLPGMWFSQLYQWLSLSQPWV